MSNLDPRPTSDRQQRVLQAACALFLRDGYRVSMGAVAREAGVSGVPSFFLDGYSLFSGAMPAETIARALRRGHEVLGKQQQSVVA